MYFIYEALLMVNSAVWNVALCTLLYILHLVDRASCNDSW